MQEAPHASIERTWPRGRRVSADRRPGARRNAPSRGSTAAPAAQGAREARLRRTVDRAESWLGSVSRAQKELLRALRPGISLSSDFIVGFPGETEEDFGKMMKLIEDIGYDTSFSFIFSPRPGTPAANLHDDTPHEVKLRRLQHLQATIEANVMRISQSRVGTVQRILVERPARNLAVVRETNCDELVHGAPRGDECGGSCCEVQARCVLRAIVSGAAAADEGLTIGVEGVAQWHACHRHVCRRVTRERVVRSTVPVPKVSTYSPTGCALPIA